MQREEDPELVVRDLVMGPSSRELTAAAGETCTYVQRWVEPRPRQRPPSRRGEVMRADVDPPRERGPCPSRPAVVLRFVLAIRQCLLPPPRPARLVAKRPEDHL